MRMIQPAQRHDLTVPLVTAVVLNWNGYEDTVKCLMSLKQATYSNLKIVLVDNASTDGSAEKLERRFPSLTVIALPRNGGYAAGNNAGIRFALEHRTDYILVLNNDVIVEKDFLQPMVEVAERDSSIGVVTCKVCYQSNARRIYSAGGTFNPWLCTGINNLQGRIDNHSACKSGQESEVSFVPGCVLLVRRSVFEKAGLLDEKFFLYFEDWEFSQRVKKHFRLMYTPRGRVYHKCGAGKAWASYTSTYLYYHTRNRLWAFKKSPLFYRFYVFIFTFLNALAKSIVLLHGARRNDPSFSDHLQNRMHALWRGVRDGVFTQPI